MAMTKKEAERVKALEDDLRLAKALRWPEPPPEPQPAPASGTGETVFGWDFNVYGTRVEEGWSRSHAHGTGRDPLHMGSQNGRALYRTRLDALLALRAAKTLEVARVLAGVDAEIERERAAAPTPPQHPLEP